jgi:hypothetical protein
MAKITINISSPNDGLGDSLRNAFDAVNLMMAELYANVVFKEAGKGLSTNDYSTQEKIKLSGIFEGAEVNVQSDLNQTDDTQDNYVIGKTSIEGALYPFTFPRLTVAQQDFTIPSDIVAKWAKVNGADWYLNDANLASEPNTFTQSGTTVTFKTVRPIGNLIVIYIQ